MNETVHVEQIPINYQWVRYGLYRKQRDSPTEETVSPPTEATYNYFLRDNVRDHRAGTSDLPFLNHTQIRLRVLYIVMRRILLF